MAIAFEPMGIEFTGAATIIRNYKELLMSVATITPLGDDKGDQLFNTVWGIFPAIRDVVLDDKYFVLRSDFDTVTVFIVDDYDECETLIKDAEEVFKRYPDPEEFVQRNKFACEISLEQFAELAGDDFNDSEGFMVDEFGLTFSFYDPEPVFQAHAEGKI